jgi:hypothetical protein
MKIISWIEERARRGARDECKYGQYGEINVCSAACVKTEGRLRLVEYDKGRCAPGRIKDIGTKNSERSPRRKREGSHSNAAYINGATKE